MHFKRLETGNFEWLICFHRYPLKCAVYMHLKHVRRSSLRQDSLALAPSIAHAGQPQSLSAVVRQPRQL